jgi:hypothetical protein
LATATLQEVALLFRNITRLKRLDTRDNPCSAAPKYWEKVVMMSPSCLGARCVRASHASHAARGCLTLWLTMCGNAELLDDKVVDAKQRDFMMRHESHRRKCVSGSNSGVATVKARLPRLQLCSHGISGTVPMTTAVCVTDAGNERKRKLLRPLRPVGVATELSAVRVALLAAVAPVDLSVAAVAATHPSPAAVAACRIPEALWQVRAPP